MPRSVQTLPRPGCFKAPSHPLPKREGTLPFALDLPIFRGEPVAEAAGLQPTPRRVAPQTAPPGPGSLGPGAGGQPGAMVWPLRTNQARQAENQKPPIFSWVQLLSGLWLAGTSQDWTPRQFMGSPVQSPSCPGITYPSTRPCFLAWRRRHASYFSAVYTGALFPRDAPAIP